MRERAELPANNSYLLMTQQVLSIEQRRQFAAPRRGVAARCGHLALVACGLTFALVLQLLVACSSARAQQPQAQQPTAGQAAEVPPTGVVTAKLLRYAEQIVSRYDTSGDGRLDATEYAAMRGDPKAADQDADGHITVDEFAQYVADYSAGRRIRLTSPRGSTADVPPVAAGATDDPLAASTAQATNPALVDARRNMKYFKPLPAGTPAWFVERDTDGDAQLTLAEYSPKLRTTEVAEFRKYDLNGDGLVTPLEVTRAASQTPAAAAAQPDGGTGVTP